MKSVLISAKPKASTRPRKARKPTHRPRIDASTGALPASLPPSFAGNDLSRIQTKLEVGEPDDSFEKEADRVADQVMRMPDSAVTGSGESLSSAPPAIQRLCSGCEHESNSEEIQRQCADCEEEEQIQRKCTECEAEEETVQRQEMDEEEELIQSKRDGGGGTPAVTPAVAADLGRLRRGGGRPLAASTRAFFEPRFDNDFSAVRVHTDDAANRLSRRLNARAFAVGNDVFFGKGEYRPQTPSGLELLAHELTHTVQQSGGRSLSEPALADPATADPEAAGALRAVGDRGHRAGGAWQRPMATRGTIQRLPAEPEAEGEPTDSSEEIEAPDIEDWESDTWLRKVRTDEVGANNFLVAKGAKGDPAELVQKAVRAWGIEHAESPRDLLPLFGADGKFESETKAAVEEFQRAHGLDDDGIVGPLTMVELNAFVHGAADKPATLDCPPGLFEVKSFVSKKGAARPIEVGTVMDKEKDEPIEIAKIPSGDVTVTAKFAVHAPTAAAKADLANWKLGLTQTMYDDVSVALWERSVEAESQLEVAGGPVIDILEKDTIPFAATGVPAHLIFKNPELGEVVTNDIPSDSMPLINPETHADCEPPDRATKYFRRLDATTFAIAFNEKANVVCPLAFVEWSQITDVKITGIATAEKDDRLVVEHVSFTPESVDGVELGAQGLGQGPRPPETTTRDGKIANEVSGPVFEEIGPCPSEETPTPPITAIDGPPEVEIGGRATVTAQTAEGPADKPVEWDVVQAPKKTKLEGDETAATREIEIWEDVVEGKAPDVVISAVRPEYLTETPATPATPVTLVIDVIPQESPGPYEVEPITGGDPKLLGFVGDVVDLRAVVEEPATPEFPAEPRQRPSTWDVALSGPPISGRLEDRIRVEGMSGKAFVTLKPCDLSRRPCSSLRLVLTDEALDLAGRTLIVTATRGIGIPSTAQFEFPIQNPFPPRSPEQRVAAQLVAILQRARKLELSEEQRVVDLLSGRTSNEIQRVPGGIADEFTRVTKELSKRRLVSVFFRGRDLEKAVKRKLHKDREKRALALLQGGGFDAAAVELLGERLCDALKAAIFLPDVEAQKKIFLPVLLSVTTGRTGQQIQALDRLCLVRDPDLLDRTRQLLEDMGLAEAATLLEGGDASFRGEAIVKTASPFDPRFAGDLVPPVQIQDCGVHNRHVERLPIQALGLMELARQNLEGPPTARLDAAVRRGFFPNQSAQPPRDDLDRVRRRAAEVLGVVRNHLLLNPTFICVSPNHPICVVKDERGAGAFTLETERGAPVHLCPAFFSASAPVQAVTIVHELVHLAGLPLDTYRDNPAWCNLPPDQAALQADSYAVLAWEAANGRVFPGSQLCP